MPTVPDPYLLFLGDVPEERLAKTARGILYWRAERCVGKHRLPGCVPDLDLAEMSPAEAAQRGAQTLVIGVVNSGGFIPEGWLPSLNEAVDAGLHVASGMHVPLATLPGLAERARARGVELIDVRRPPAGLKTGTGAPRSGRRLLTVGTDCSVGKMYASLALTDALRARGVDADFRATGQTGILIAGSGIPVDAVVADFIAGSVEELTPAAPDDHWDLIEGQGSLFHPAFAGVTLGLVHGAQAHALVLCHDASRTQIASLPAYPQPSLGDCVRRYEEAARLTNSEARVVGVCLNTSALDEEAAHRAIAEATRETGLPACDPVRTGVDPVADAVLGV
jgi:uncharacterized NAD-dependent epimerase/dehydratase family protein